MMGERRVNQEALFYAFSLERHVPTDHLVRAIDRFIDLSDLRSRLAPFYSGLKAMCPTTQRSPRTGTAASATAIFSVTCSRPLFGAAWQRD